MYATNDELNGEIFEVYDFFVLVLDPFFAIEMTASLDDMLVRQSNGNQNVLARYRD